MKWLYPLAWIAILAVIYVLIFVVPSTNWFAHHKIDGFVFVENKGYRVTK